MPEQENVLCLQCGCCALGACKRQQERGAELSGPPNVKGLDERGCAGGGEWVILVLPLLRLEFFLDKKGF